MSGLRVGELYQDRVGQRYRLLEVLPDKLRVEHFRLGQVGFVRAEGLTLVERRGEHPIVKSFPLRDQALAWAHGFKEGRRLSGYAPLVVESYLEGWVVRDPGKGEDLSDQRQRRDGSPLPADQDRGAGRARSARGPGGRVESRPLDARAQRRACRLKAAPVQRLIDVQDEVNPMVVCDKCRRSLRERDSMIYKGRRLCASCL